MKKIARIFVIGFLLVVSGCIFEKRPLSIKDPSTTVYTNSNTYTSSTFNDEEYVWEYFIFSTNKVIKAK